ncbi:3122_t:CDS:2 [Funneliformis geosporum]|uniref:3122_t:CDS:1 n=1 Tax=Funneliformis geosporum TaxID=1117311 RepID=A0A9W4X147_9GLOM|nr:3122_t:CDS:2 [Funneliformis geosporum]
MPAFFKALNSLTAGIKSARLAPVGWINKSACLAISKVLLLVRADPSMIIKSYCLVSAVCTCAVAAGTACVCVATGGLAAPKIVGIGAASSFGGYLVGNQADKESAEREKLLM